MRVEAHHPNLRDLGWCNRRNPSCTAWIWSGTGVVMRFEGRGVRVHLEGDGMLEVLLDGKPALLLGPEIPDEPIDLASDLGPGPHEIVLRKRTEPVAGSILFLGFDLDGEVLPPLPPPPYLLFLGDSLTCGYGNLAESESEGFQARTEDVFRSFAGIAASHLGLGFQASAWSGKGLLRNFDRDGSPTIPDLWRVADPNEAHILQAHPDRPVLAIINLGSNDVFHDDPDWELFTQAAVQFAREIRQAFPGLPLVWLDGPVLSDTDRRSPDGSLRPVLTQVRRCLDTASGIVDADAPSYRLSLTPCLPGEAKGADSHPSLYRHREAGRELSDFLRTLPWLAS
ncbi:MAG: hypothetical protein H6686_10125 [Fibrobacteria bacterium]|nr:hypothetical protein [Fibrobacteria bacterium]